ncbi:mechanosensitive ion channel family protein [Sphingobium sp. BYY-5]|uniref:mechanosensitive ion channel family protein n=1 Tax=Sphingobium sp. BYY-5 TaxID=2926400 RepID=UPI001FA6F344|nr:mechanosensitive ion channel domain-containing protein [Sphingobium sp. BYY-5]MCI4589130.1 mechanosensitive ion channel family protein [Sphingobium sp. BYY-5]
MKELFGPLVMQLFDPTQIIGALVYGGIFFVLGIILSWVVRRLIATALKHDQSDRIDQITLSFLSHLAILILWLILLACYAHLVPPLNRIGTALLAGVSLVSVIVGFAAQTTLGNLVAGISLVLYKPFRRGDRIQIAAPTKDEFEVGTVEDISLGYTVLRTDDGREIIIANGAMAQQTMIRLPRSTSTQAEPQSDTQQTTGGKNV